MRLRAVLQGVAWVMGVGLSVAACAGSTGSTTAPDAGSSSGGGTFCSADSDCGAGNVCRGGVCEANQCAAREDCPSGQVCTDGECLAYTAGGTCATTEECPAPYLCDGFSRRCFNPDTGEFWGAGSSSSSGGASASASSASASSSSASASSSTASSSSSSSTTGGTYDLGGWRIENDEGSGAPQVTRIPDNTRVPRGGVLVIARDATQSEFEAFWGVTLGSQVTFLNNFGATSAVPVINGNEEFSIFDRSNTRVDGPTISGSANKTFRRTRAASPGSTASWSVDPEGSATPGQTELPGGTTGVLVSEWSDAGGSGNYVFEFIEVYVNP